jgi:hypothetical protein
MKQIFIIGTLHGGWTPGQELQGELEKIKPDQLLVEICDSDLKDGEIDGYPPEMIFAYQWAKENQVPVVGYDSRIKVFKDGVSDQDNQDLIEKQKQQFGQLSWKDANKLENRGLFKGEDYYKLVDPEKDKLREQEMLDNIKDVIADQGRTVVLTGCGHLGFFEKNLSEAEFPLNK